MEGLFSPFDLRKNIGALGNHRNAGIFRQISQKSL